MQFEYDDNTPSVETAVHQALGAASACWTDLLHAGEFESDRAVAIGESLLAEIRKIWADELHRLLEPTGIAAEWNEAIEQAVRVILGGKAV